MKNRENDMQKWAVYTKWQHQDGMNDHQAMRDHMSTLKGKTAAVEILWWQVDENHHQSVLVYPDEATAKTERAQLEANRQKDVENVKVKMVEEVQGPVISQFSEL